MTDNDLRASISPSNRLTPAYPERQPSGHNLSQLLSSAPAPTGLVIPSFLSVIAAVQETQSANKGPCNLDPRRIFFRSDGTVKLSHLTPLESGMTFVLSSSKYSAPEMVEEMERAITNADLDCYVLGFVFYEILLGKDLFERQFQDVTGHGDFGWLSWHADNTKHAKPLFELISGFPFVLSSLIEKMMTKKTSERITDLDRIADTIGGASHATILITNLSELQHGDESYAPLKQSFLQKVDAFWRRLMSAAPRSLQKPLWERMFTKSH